MTTNPVYDSSDREYARARVRLRDLTGDSNPIQKLMDADGDGLVFVTDRNDDGEQVVYSTRNPELIHEFCDRLEAERASN